MLVPVLPGSREMGPRSFRCISVFVVAVFVGGPPLAAQDHPEAPHRHPDAQELENPVPSTAASVSLGKALYLHYCRTCHGVDGRAHVDMVEFLAYPPSDLTDDVWRHGSSDGEIFMITREGTLDDMEAFGDRLTTEQIWHVVNYVRTLGPG